MRTYLLILIFCIHVSEARAGLWIWESNEDDTDLRVTVEGVGESYEDALADAKGNDLWNSTLHLIAECPKDGWMARGAVAFPKNHERASSTGGFCEKSSKDSAIRSALESCKRKSSCARELTTLQYDITVWWAKVEGSDRLNDETCVWQNIGNPDYKICFTGGYYPGDDEIMSYPRFDIKSFLEKYSN
ncbi:hypothetical protein PMI27_000609 [Pseudomonas sp. GM41(2012)]|uniref:hypothetical protein n=1 Tax=Pseudomonas sp. (strain GM41(2012)) TaxID=1144708 RepID=UPI00027053FF|nr:hypothetical protein [Pseudomonas sp. GM41(2012)]EUB74433.1 hypothetical protein PMI27_000609 [Pseudomonas sp. GM41(2012)]